MEWISVKERLPESDVEVLVLGKDKSISIRYIPKNIKEAYNAGNGSLSWYPGGWGIGWTTHWQPLPKPPIKKPCVGKKVVVDGVEYELK